MTRSYRLKRRAERQDQTRQKIVEAAIALHQDKGLAATTMADVAERAGVGRVTVYRHFPDEAALVGACSGQYFERHPLPDPELWLEIADPVAPRSR
jgi:AcrR family transcriptional regulator